VGDGSDGMSGDGGEVFDDCESEVAGGRAGRMLIAVSGDSVTSCSSLVPGTCMNICGREGCGRVIVYCGVGDGVTDSVGNGESVCDSDSVGIGESVGDSECVGVDESVCDSVCIGESVDDSECVGESECVGVDEGCCDSAGVDAVFWSCVELITSACAVVWPC